MNFIHEYNSSMWSSTWKRTQKLPSSEFRGSFGTAPATTRIFKSDHLYDNDHSWGNAISHSIIVKCTARLSEHRMMTKSAWLYGVWHWTWIAQECTSVSLHIELYINIKWSVHMATPSQLCAFFRIMAHTLKECISCVTKDKKNSTMYWNLKSLDSWILWINSTLWYDSYIWFMNVLYNMRIVVESTNKLFPVVTKKQLNEI